MTDLVVDEKQAAQGMQQLIQTHELPHASQTSRELNFLSRTDDIQFEFRYDNNKKVVL